MPVVAPLLASAALLVWSVIANLAIGERLYVARNLVLATVLLLVARANGVGWREIGVSRETLAGGTRWGLSSVGIVVVAVVVGVLLRDLVPLVNALLADDRAALTGGELAWAALVRIPVGTALFEEVAFRGVLLAGLMHVTSTPWAVTWSSLVFGLWHVAPTIVALRINGVDPGSGKGVAAIAGSVAATTVAGVLFALLRLVSGSLLAPVLAHWATNVVGLVAAGVLDGDPADDDAELSRSY